MIRSLIRVIVVALIANATWHVFTAYLAHYRFRDAVENVSQFSAQLSEEDVASRVLEVAEQYDIPTTAGQFTVKRQEAHTIIDGSYVRAVEMLPGWSYAWPFSWHVDTFVVKMPAPALPLVQ